MNKDMNKFQTFSIVLLVLLALFKPFSAFAQSCEIIPATITTMKSPSIGSYNLWDSTYGEFESQEHFIGALRDGTDYVVLGESAADNNKKPDLFLTKIDQRGREVWTRVHEIPSLLSAHRILDHKDGYIVLGTANDSVELLPSKVYIWIGFFDRNGSFLKHSKLRDAKGGLYADDILALDGEETSYAVAGHMINQDGADFDAVVYVINADGVEQKQRVYRSGSNTRILKLLHGAKGQILGAGETRDAYKRPIGWAVNLDYALKLLWAQSFPRGIGAVFNGGVKYDDTSVILTGSVQGKDQNPPAAWVMKVTTAGGEPLWERFYRGERAYNAVDAIVSDGLISVVMNGFDLEVNRDVEDYFYQPSEHDFVRLITLNTRGEFLLNEDYLNGRGAGLSHLLLGPYNERVLVGWTQSPEAVPNSFDLNALVFFPETASSPAEDEKTSMNGWMLSTPATDPYKDPCLN